MIYFCLYFGDLHFANGAQICCFHWLLIFNDNVYKVELLLGLVKATLGDPHYWQIQLLRFDILKLSFVTAAPGYENHTGLSYWQIWKNFSNRLSKVWLFHHLTVVPCYSPVISVTLHITGEVFILDKQCTIFSKSSMYFVKECLNNE